MKNSKYFPLIIFFANLSIYALFNFGGIRSPDSEIVFRTTESLTLRNEFAVPEPIDWENFGLSLGTNNKRYSIFGPGESIAAVPLLKLAYFLERNDFILDSSYIPISFHINIHDKLAGTYYIENKRPPFMGGQYERFITSFFNSIVGALSGMFLYFVLVQITKSKPISLLTTFIFSYGSLIFPYTATFFSEPLCTMFIILSFLFILKNERLENISNNGLRNYFYSGSFLGLAVVTHISAVLSVPFYYIFILGQVTKDKVSFKRLWRPGLYFTLGLSIWGAMLLYYNYTRFGNIFETGRTIAFVHYANYSNPLVGLYGLLFSPGKGLFIYSPIIILSIIFWKSFHQKFPHLSTAVIAMIFIRVFFIASRSDWHGGFCLGPRYFVIILPFLFIPIALGLQEVIKQKKVRYFISLNIFGFICISQQIFFSVGEIFSYLYIQYFQQKERGIDLLLHNNLYLDWKFSPAVYNLNYNTGPFFLKFLSTNNYLLWFVMCTILLILFLISSLYAYKTYTRDQSTLNPGS